MITRKNIDVTDGAIKSLSLQAIEKGYKNFKNYAEHILEFMSSNGHLIKAKAKNGKKK